MFVLMIHQENPASGIDPIRPLRNMEGNVMQFATRQEAEDFRNSITKDGKSTVTKWHDFYTIEEV
jgi:hypothetical protein